MPLLSQLVVLDLNVLLITFRFVAASRSAVIIFFVIPLCGEAVSSAATRRLETEKVFVVPGAHSSFITIVNIVSRAAPRLACLPRRHATTRDGACGKLLGLAGRRVELTLTDERCNFQRCDGSWLIDGHHSVTDLWISSAKCHYCETVPYHISSLYIYSCIHGISVVIPYSTNRYSFMYSLRTFLFTI